MGKKWHLNPTAPENLTDTFKFTKSHLNGCPYLDPSRQPGNVNQRWRGKQFGTQFPHRPASSNFGVVANGSSDCLFRDMPRMYEGDSSEIKRKPGYLLGRDAYTNTVETERMREILKKELRATDAAMKRYAAAKLREMEQNKKNGMSDLERRMRARLANRKYRPTSADSIGQGLHVTAALNRQSYQPPMDGFPTAYDCPQAHRPVIISDSAPGFFRRTTPSPVSWVNSGGSGAGARGRSRGL